MTKMCILLWLNLNVQAAEDKYTKLTLESTQPGRTVKIGRVSKLTPSTNSTATSKIWTLLKFKMSSLYDLYDCKLESTHSGRTEKIGRVLLKVNLHLQLIQRN